MPVLLLGSEYLPVAFVVWSARASFVVDREQDPHLMHHGASEGVRAGR